MSDKGHFRPIDGIRAMSAHPPTPVKLMQRSEGRNGPAGDIALGVREVLDHQARRDNARWNRRCFRHETLDRGYLTPAR